MIKVRINDSCGLDFITNMPVLPQVSDCIFAYKDGALYYFEITDISFDFDIDNNFKYVELSVEMAE